MRRCKPNNHLKLQSKAREDMSTMLLQKRYSPWHWSCGTDTLSRSPLLTLLEKGRSFRIFQLHPIIHPNSSPQALLPTRMNATLKVFIAFSPRLNRASPSNQPYENRFTSTQYRLYQGIPNHKSKKLAMVDDNEGLFVVGLNSLPTPHIWATVNIWYIAPSHHF